MKITHAQRIETLIVTTDHPDHPTFRRDENGHWEQAIGESWEYYLWQGELNLAFDAFDKDLIESST